MSGIFGHMGEHPDAAELVLTGLKRLEYCGYDSWGIAASEHTRWATHRQVTDENAHPQLDCGARLAVVHNGVVANEAQLRQALSRAGHRLRSQTDTELIAHLIEDLLEHAPEGPERLLHATIAAFRKLRGLNAITVLDMRRGEMVAAKSGSPLCVGMAESDYLLTSNNAALLDHTRRVCFVRDGQALLLKRNGARLFDMASGQEITPETA